MRAFQYFLPSLIAVIIITQAIYAQPTSAPHSANLPVKREKPQTLNILWDTSYSMENRDLGKEMGLLNRYFAYLGSIEVRFIEFGYLLEAPVHYSISNGNWDELAAHIGAITYDGACQKEVLEALRPSGITLLFTDGQGFQPSFSKDWEGPVFIVNSGKAANHHLLTELAVSSGANYLPLQYISTASTAFSALTTQTDQQLIFAPGKHPERFRSIPGNVTDFDDPLENILVTVEGSERYASTDSNGDFSIEAKNNEVLIFTAKGRDVARAMVNPGTNLLRIAVPMGVNVLDEVVLEQGLDDVQREAPLDNDVSTNYGKLHARRSGFAIKQIDGKDLNQATQTIMQAISGKFSGVDIRGDRVVVRGGFPRLGPVLGAAWDVDGNIYPPANPPFHINVQNVASITIMAPSWSAARYGTVAAGGIIIVRTVGQTTQKLKEVDAWGNKRTNIYKGGASFLVQNEASAPAYIKVLENSESVEQAYSNYLSQRGFYNHRPVFYYDVSRWFKRKGSDTPYAGRILSNLPELFGKDPTSLKIAAYALEMHGKFPEAHEVYRQIHRTKPTPQSLRDLANISRITGDTRRAWRFYSQYLSQADSMYATGTDRLVREEMIDILRKEGKNLGLDTSGMDLETDENDLTILVEWNNPNAEFNLQFVGPESLFYIWNNKTAVTEKNALNGYLADCFFIEDLSKGPWGVNITYLGNRENTPSFVKFTVKDRRKNSIWTDVVKLELEKVSIRYLEINENRILTSIP